MASATGSQSTEKPEPRSWKRAFAWMVLAFGIVGVGLGAGIMFAERELIPNILIVAFCMVLVLDRAMYLRGVYRKRQERPVWNVIYNTANLLMMLSLLLRFAMEDPNRGMGLLLASAALAASLVMVIVAMLMSGLNWRGETARRS